MAIGVHKPTRMQHSPRSVSSGNRPEPRSTRAPNLWRRIAGSVRHGHGQDLERSDRAARWFEGAVGTWEREGRIDPADADALRQKLSEPLFMAVLPHFGVHLAIGVVLRFPIGSITRATYTLVNLLLGTLRFALRRIDRRSWRQATSIHSPLVVIVAGMPGIGTFA
jgi:hypothetical protein